jgi:hypothetical protein
MTLPIADFRLPIGRIGQLAIGNEQSAMTVIPFHVPHGLV